MLLKAGVSLKNLNRECRRALQKLEAQYPDFVVTSTDEGEHMPSSLHYAGDAIDIRPRTFWGRQIEAGDVRELLGPGFDVVDEETHIHIEWDPA